MKVVIFCKPKGCKKVQTLIKILFVSSMVCCAACANQGINADYIASDTASVSVQRGPNISHDGAYQDPLYYNYNAFDYLYFN